MEKKAVYQTKNLQESSINKQEILESFTRLKKAFPELSSGWFEELNAAIIRNGFTSERLKEAVDNLIDTYKFQRPTIAEIINYKKREYYTYEAIIQKFGVLDEGWQFDKERKLFFRE